MFRTFIAALIATSFLAGCQTTTSAPPTAAKPVATQPAVTVSSRTAMANYNAALRRVEPVAERECRARTEGVNCDFLISIDPRADLPPNAYQSVTKQGRPTITFTQSLLRQARNVDEVAFVMSHEAAHHMRGHLNRQTRDAMTGAVLTAVVAGLAGANAATLQSMTDLGAQVGARAFSKDYELEADALGTVIAHKAGFNPVRGAKFFQRIPDPGDRFLGSHPPNAQRIEIVRQTAAKL